MEIYVKGVVQATGPRAAGTEKFVEVIDLGAV